MDSDLNNDSQLERIPYMEVKDSPSIKFIKGSGTFYKKFKFILEDLVILKKNVNLPDSEWYEFAKYRLWEHCTGHNITFPKIKKYTPLIINEIDNDFTPFYKYITPAEFENVIKNGIWQLDCVEQFRKHENINIRNEFEGYTLLNLNINNYIVSQRFISGFNYLIFSGTKSNHSLHQKEEFGDKKLYFPNVKDFAESIKKTIGAKRYIIQNIQYNNLRFCICNDLIQNPKIDIKNMYSPAYFDLLKKYLVYPCLFVKPEIFKKENEVRIVFEMNKDFYKPYIFEQKKLHDYVLFGLNNSDSSQSKILQNISHEENGKDFTFIVSEFLEHFSVTHRDLLNPSCRLYWFDNTIRLKQEKGLYWLMFSKLYHLFVCGFENGIFFLRRNNSLSEMNDVNFKLRELPDGPCIVQIAWGVDFIELELTIGDKEKREDLKVYNQKKITTPSYPALELIRWVDKQNLIEKLEYSSEEEFRNKIIAIIKGLQEKVNISSNVNEFWNIIKTGNNIVKRIPKDETDIQAAIIRMISDQLILANIFVSPEYDTGIGKVDMIFSAQIKDSGIRTIVMEIKNAHSKDLLDGLNIQLPLYMKSKKSKYGIYLVLWYKSEWFEDKTYDSMTSLSIDITHSYLLSEYHTTSVPEKTTLEILDLTKGITASKVKKS